MSQRMEYNEGASQQQAGYDDGYQGGYQDPFAPASAPAQKLGMTFQSANRTTPSAGQRLALAIVSVCMFVPLAAVTLGISTAFGGFGLIGGLIILTVMSCAILGINLAFNLAHHP